MNSLAIKKEKGLNNPIIAQRFLADPYAIEYEGRIYVYGSNDSGGFYKNDAGEYYKNFYGNIKGINCISSDDMVNWTDHGIIQVAADEHSKREGIAKWASNSWAPAVCYNKVKDEKTGEEKTKFFLYFANSAANIGVLEADSPIGPWRDPLGKPMIIREDAGVAGVEWLFDPAVLVDDDGTGYIYFGGGVPSGMEKAPKTGRVAKLGKDMISLDGPAVLIDAPYMFEDSGINKIGDTYYYSYCSNWSEEAGQAMGKAQISYMTSKNPMGPFTYQGEMMQNPGQSQYFSGKALGNNHHCVLAVDGVHYMFYHTPQYEIDMNIPFENAPEKSAYRTSYVDVMDVYEDGKVRVHNMTKTGTAKQLKNVNPYEENKAVTFAWGEGVATEPKKISKDARTCEMDMSLDMLDNGDWTGLSKVDFGDGTCNNVKVKASSEVDFTISFYADEIDDKNLIASVKVGKTDSINDYSEFTGNIVMDKELLKGVHDLIISFKGAELSCNALFDIWKFE